MDDLILRDVSSLYEVDVVPTLLFDIYVKSLKKVVGRIEYRVETGKDLIYYGNVGYVIYRPYRGHSYAYYACVKLLSYLKENIEGIESVIFTCNPDNIASKKTIEKLDVTYLGQIDIDKDHELYKMGDTQKDCYIIYL